VLSNCGFPAAAAISFEVFGDGATCAIAAVDISTAVKPPNHAKCDATRLLLLFMPPTPSEITPIDNLTA
jgi:hypothetical protein